MAERKVTTRLDANVSGFVRGMAEAKAATAALNRELNTSNDHTAWLVGSLLALAPAAVPIGATAAPAVAALATQAGLAAAAGGVMALAFIGVGDALSALNKAQLEPTKENLEALDQAMKKIGPDGAEFVKFLDSVGPQFRELQMAARAGMFPGIEEGITAFMDRLPDLKAVVTEIAKAVGDLARGAGESLAGPEWDAFFEFLKLDAGPILRDTGKALGNFIEGLASMTVAFGPTTRDFSAGLLDMSRRFEQWAEQLESSDSFRAFIDYVREVTPMVKQFLGQLVDTFIELSVAAAPVGEAMLPVLTAMLNILGEIAKTPIGPILIAVTAVGSLAGRLIALKNLASGGLIGSMLTGQFLAVGRGADDASRKVQNAGNQAVVAGTKWRTAGTLGLFALGTGLSMVNTESDRANTALGVLGSTATGAALGTAILPGWGTALGAVAGSALGVVNHLDDAEEATERARQAAEEWRAAFPTQQDIDELKNFQSILLDPGAAPKPVREDKPKPIGFKQKATEQKVVTRYESIGVQASVTQAAKVARAANMTPRNVRTWLQTIGWSTAKINAVVRELERARSLARVRAQLQQTGWSTEKIDAAVDALRNAKSAAHVRAVLSKKGFETKEIDAIIKLLGVVGKAKPEPKAKVRDEASGTLRDIQSQLNNLHDKTITITTVKRTVTQPAGGGALMGGTLHSFADGGFPWGSSVARAAGAISGPGTDTSDSIPAMLSNGEHVLTASDVRKAGGQDAIFRLRAGIQSGALQFADGGAALRAARAVAAAGGRGGVGGSDGAALRVISGRLLVNGLDARIEAIAEDVVADRVAHDESRRRAVGR